MFKKILPAYFFLSTSIGLFAQGTETRPLPPFRGIEIESISRIYLRQDSIQTVRVASEGAFKNVETRVSNGILVVEGGPGTELYISMPQLEKINIEGKGEIIGQTPFTGDKLNLEIGGDGKMNMEVHYREVKANINGLGKITLSGNANYADFDISGFGKIDAFDLKTVNARTIITGIGKCLIDVSDTLSSSISGSGVVTYKNEPKFINKNVSGLGKINDYQNRGSKADTTAECVTHIDKTFSYTCNDSPGIHCL